MQQKITFISSVLSCYFFRRYLSNKYDNKFGNMYSYKCISFAHSVISLLLNMYNVAKYSKPLALTDIVSNTELENNIITLSVAYFTYDLYNCFTSKRYMYISTSFISISLFSSISSSK